MNRKEYTDPCRPNKVPALNLKSDKLKTNKTQEDNSQDRSDSKPGKKLKAVPSLKLPTRTDRS